MERPLKEAKSYEEQINNLIEVHGLLVLDRTSAKEILSTVNYYRLSAFGIGLMQKENPEKYKPGISIEHIYNLYQFDSCLRNIITPLIEYVEISFRTKLAYQLAMTYGAEGYIDSTNFRSKKDKEGNDIFARVSRQLNDEINRQNKLPFVKHHIDTYGGHFPIWVAIELFSFGMVCSLYSICSNQDRKKIATEYRIDPKHLSGWMIALLELRNMCAHYNRIYNMYFKQTVFLPAEYQQYQGNKLFPILLVLKMLVKESMWNIFVKNLHDLFARFPEAKPGFMGFPKNWHEIMIN
ncbi:MAG: Abi family protein [Firmicutes bacterium]|nr:Abi family protein [Bacillota bacterium]